MTSRFSFLYASLAGLIACAAALPAADLTGKWASAPIFLVLKQDGSKLSGTGGPTEKQQFLTFDNGTIDGDHITFKLGQYAFDLKLIGEELKGEVKMGPEPTPVSLKRVADHPNAAPRSFEVASVKRASPPADGGIRSSMKLDPGRLTCTNVSLKKLIVESYGVKDYQVSGPDWLGSEIYDIAATLPQGTTGDDVMQMIQTLLAERFKLALRRESREMPVYALVVAKSGAKLQEVEFGRGSTSSGNGKFTATRIPIRNLTEFLSRQTTRPVLDMTGLKGFYSFEITYTPEDRAAPPIGSPVSESVVGPSLIGALQDQLGLKLEARKAPVEVLVVEHAEKVPTEN